MPRTRFISLEEAADLIPDGAIVTVSSSSGLGCPDAMLKAIGQRFKAQRAAFSIFAKQLADRKIAQKYNRTPARF